MGRETATDDRWELREFRANRARSAEGLMPEGGTPFLICRLGSELAALPISAVSETMRPLPVEPVASAPGFVLGVAVIRSVATPVVELARLLGAPARETRRFVVVRAGARQVALAVESVAGVRTLKPAELGALPALLTNGDRGAIEALGTLDSELCFVLESGRLVPESLFESLDSTEARP